MCPQEGNVKSDSKLPESTIASDFFPHVTLTKQSDMLHPTCLQVIDTISILGFLGP